MNKDVLLSRTTSELTTGNACWETPPALFAKLHTEFNFDIDLCADIIRTLCPVWFGPGSPHHTNALEISWEMFGTCGFANPPYGRFVPHLLRRAKESAEFYGFTSVLLLPMRVTRAFRQYILDGAAELRFCDTRITFWEHGAPRRNPRTGSFDPAPFDSIIVVFRPGRYARPAVDTWAVPPTPRPDRQRKDLALCTAQRTLALDDSINNATLKDSAPNVSVLSK